VNVHRAINRIHALLQKDDDVHILLIQEPWFSTVATLRSDTDPLGDPQLGAPINSKWDVHVPSHAPGTRCKVIAYSRKTLSHLGLVHNITTHPLSTAMSIVLDIKDRDDLLLRVVNIYHEVLQRGHGLHHLFTHTFLETVPTLVIGNFNTHSRRWSLPDRAPSPWARRMEEWIDEYGFSILNPPHEPTWYGSRDGDRPSVIDLALANNCAFMSNQLGDVTVSLADSLGSDHAALLLTLIPTDSIEMIPLPAPKGYHADPERRENWIGEYARLLAKSPLSLSICRAPSDHGSTTAHGIMVQEYVNTLDDIIEQVSRATLEPKRAPNPNGANWWNDSCSAAHTAARTTTGAECRKASKHLRLTVVAAKCDWAHECLHEAVDAKDIWTLASCRKGRRMNLFPALQNSAGDLVEQPGPKADLFRQRFFPAQPLRVDPIQASDPLPRPTRTWPPITTDEVLASLRDTKPTSAPGPSGVGYLLLKWAHSHDPDVLPCLFNQCLENGTHPWRTLTVAVINKPHKPDYSLPKAYHPISLLECMGKLLEKIIAKRVNADIAQHGLLPMTQFGSWPQHCAVDAVATLVHRIQGTRATGHAGALLLFDISGFFDNINPARAVSIFSNRGFPTNVCMWVSSFLSE
jgi:hypothetical protein